MSYINSALRKVQKERDSRYAAYGEFISSRRRAGSSTAGTWRVFVLPAVVAGALGVLALVAWLLYPAATAKVKISAPRPPLGVAVRDLTATGPALPVVGKAAPVAADGEHAAALARAVPVYEAALAAQRAKRWPEAERLYQQTLAFDPHQVEAMNNLGVLYMNQKRPEAAMELFFKALAIKDNYVDPYYNLACLYAQQGNIKAGLSYLERAAKIDGQVKKWAKEDNDFKKMKSLPEFNKITEELIK